MKRIYSTTRAPMKSCIANFKCHQILLAAFSAYLYFSTAALAVVDPIDILIASDGAASDQLGWSVAISGNTAIVGAPLNDDVSGNSGSAYIFLNDGAGNWTQQQKLTASFIAPDDTNQPPDADALPCGQVNCRLIDWLETDWLLSQFGKQRKRATDKYIDFVREGIGLPSIWKNQSNSVFLGDEAFVGQYQKMVLEKTELDEVPALQKRASLKTISYFQAKYEDTNIAIKEAYLTGGHTMKEIGQHFGKHYTMISRIIKRCE
jgi:hypothetical protein